MYTALHPDKANLIYKLYVDAFNDRSIRFIKPTFDVSEVFDLDLFKKDNPGRKLYSSTRVQKIESILITTIREKYPNFPGSGVNAIYSGFAKEVHPLQLYGAKDISSKEENVLVEYIDKKLSSSNGFPWVNVIDLEWKLVYETIFGIKMFLYDIYQQQVVHNRTKASSFREATVNLLRMAPTVIYEQPEKISSTFPVTFMLCNPFFTYPRVVPTFLGETSFKMSLFDMYATARCEMYATKTNGSLIQANIDILYKDKPDLASLTKRLYKRQVLASGGDVIARHEFDGRQEFLLQKEKLKMRNTVLLQPTLQAAIVDAMLEAVRREARQKVKDAYETNKNLQRDIERVRMEM